VVTAGTRIADDGIQGTSVGLISGVIDLAARDVDAPSDAVAGGAGPGYAYAAAPGSVAIRFAGVDAVRSLVVTPVAAAAGGAAATAPAAWLERVTPDGATVRHVGPVVALHFVAITATAARATAAPTLAASGPASPSGSPSAAASAPTAATQQPPVPSSAPTERAHGPCGRCVERRRRRRERGRSVPSALPSTLAQQQPPPSDDARERGENGDDDAGDGGGHEHVDANDSEPARRTRPDALSARRVSPSSVIDEGAAPRQQSQSRSKECAACRARREAKEAAAAATSIQPTRSPPRRQG
jgi:hypothetical protein